MCDLKVEIERRDLLVYHVDEAAYTEQGKKGIQMK